MFGMLVSQSELAVLAGIVTDSDGNALPGVLVSIQGSKFSRHDVTDENGRFRIIGIPAGGYVITYTMEGFKTVSYRGISFSAGQKKRTVQQMELAKIETVVEVVGELPVIDVKSQSRGVTLKKEVFQRLPKGRNFDSLDTTVPGVNDEPLIAGISVDGASGAENMFYVDGVDTGRPGDCTTPGGGSIDLSNGSQSSYDRPPGGFINVITRSGGGSCRHRKKKKFPSTEEYSRIYSNEFKEVMSEPLSTFSIDVDTASYANVRRFIRNHQFPYKDAVRLEEMINYFDYDYPQPEGDQPFSIVTEVAECPWEPDHHLVHIGLKGKEISRENQKPSNLVFLLDVSGSMDTPNKLPLLRQAFGLMIPHLTSEDRVTIVVYAGSAGLVLDSTAGNQKDKIREAIDRLRAGGSTAGGAGIKLAYRKAADEFIKGGNNRVVLATDGDFNVGISSTSSLVRFIENKREEGIFLTVLGFGMGNYKDHRLEQLADKGNGNYYYIDGILEAKKVLVDELGSTLFTIAKDVKIQVEFNPAKVKSYRLIGYENRLLNKKDFKDDKKDAGELGSGHTVTALYELVPAGLAGSPENEEPLKYQKVTIKKSAWEIPELMMVKLRYKPPEEKKSRLIVSHVSDRIKKLDHASDNFRFSGAVAQFGMLLRDPKVKKILSYDQVVMLAKGSMGKDSFGYRAEFIQLVKTCALIDRK